MASALPPDLEAYVKQKLDAGEFSSRDELEAHALAVYRELESQHADLRAEVQGRIDQAERGEVVPFDKDDVEGLARDLSAELNEDGTPRR